MEWRHHKFHLVAEGQADESIREIYAEAKQLLSLPFVPLLFEALASYPTFLERFWQAAKPMIRTEEFFSAAERLGAEAYTRIHNYFNVPDLRVRIAELQFSPGAQNELWGAVELYFYGYPVLLLLSASLDQTFENPVHAPHDGTFPAQPPAHPGRPILVPEDVAPPSTRRIYEEIRQRLGTPFLETAYASFGRWPEFLQTFWTMLKPLMETPVYEQHRMALHDSALTLAASLPVPLQVPLEEMDEHQLSNRELQELAQLAELFVRLQSAQVLNMAFAKIGLEGGTRGSAVA